MATLRDLASELDIPIDGLVLRYDDLPYSVCRGRTGRFYKDGKAFKFEDDTLKPFFVRLNGRLDEPERLLRGTV